MRIQRRRNNCFTSPKEDFTDGRTFELGRICMFRERKGILDYEAKT